MRLSRLILSEQLQRAGIPGMLGLALSAFAAVATLSALLPARRELADTLQAVDTARTRVSRADAADRQPSEEDQLAAFYAYFPPRERAPEQLENVYQVAEAHGLMLVRGDYTVAEDRKAGLVSYQALLPLSGQYGQIRAFVDDALQAVPTLAVDELDFARERISDTHLSARVRLNLYLARP